jgi:tetratricopeptide (TPR) repeat protein
MYRISRCEIEAGFYPVLILFILSIDVNSSSYFLKMTLEIPCLLIREAASGLGSATIHHMVGRRQFLFFAMVLIGCATHRPLPPAHPAQFGWVGNANLTLEQITPVPVLKAPATQPSTRPPIEALMLYTQARDATLRGQPQLARELLQRAIVLDPYRFDLRYDLGWAYVNSGNAGDLAINAFEKAAQLKPSSIEVQTELGRLYLDKSNLPAALTHLRLATQTPAYAANDGQAAVVDFYLGEALKDSGYDRAALNQYTRLLERLNNPSVSLVQNPELGAVLNRPNSLLEQIGELLEKHGDYTDALKAFKPGVDREPDNFDLQSRYARDLALNGQRDDALGKAVDLVVRERASKQSLSVLREVCRLLKIDNGVVSELRKLIARRPNDHAVLFALADTLVSRNRSTEAWDLLQNAWQKNPGDIAITRRLFAIDKQLEQVNAAAAMLIHALACNPDAMSNYLPLWLELLRYGQTNRLTLVQAAVMKVPPEDEAARQVWLAITAANDNRVLTQRTALAAAIGHTPPFAPAFRMLLQADEARADLSPTQKNEAAGRLIAVAKNSGDPALAAELRGRSLLGEKSSAPASDAFAEAIKLGGRSADLLLASAEADRSGGRDSTFEQALWRIISDHQLYAPAYLALYSYYSTPEVGTVDQVMKVLVTWRANDSQSSEARLRQARLDAELGNTPQAQAELASLFADDPDDDQVVGEMALLYGKLGRTNELIARLEEARTASPRDTDLVAQLAGLYADQNRKAEAIRLLDSTRTLVADDADQLYSLAGSYESLGQKQTAEDVLQQVIAIDPTHAGACNDLGFAWAEQDRNLPQALSLVRVAVAKEPDNSAFLDSLGWVLFKLGRLEEARGTLQQAVALQATPDATVMDHLGDTLFRMSRVQEALNTWKQSLKGLEEARPDQKQLRLRLMEKIRKNSKVE